MNDDGVIIFTLQIENDGLKKELMIRDGVIRKLENDCETLRRVIEKLEKEIREYDIEEKEFFKPREHLIYVSPIQKYPDVIPKEYNKKINIYFNINYVINIKLIKRNQDSTIFLTIE